jgi:1,4-alpha-glucan branching enzyme
MDNHTKARVILALHAHLPYVRIPDKRFPLQELWLYQALTESYIPLILCFRELIEEKINFNITLSISPTLVSMLSDEYYKTKYQDYLRTLLEILRIKSSNSEGGQKHSLAGLLNKIQTISNFYIEIKRNVISELKTLSQSGKVNIITTSATHALLPLFRFSGNLIRNQIKISQCVFKNEFGFVPEGFWLPEMGYYANLDKILSEFNIKYTFLDAHSVYLGSGRPSCGNFYPSVTKSGVKILPRDLPLSNTIWAAKTGYPGDYSYREFHFDYTYSLNDSELNEYQIDRIPFGLKIFRITGNDKPKEFYNHEEAMRTVNIHSEDYINKIRERAKLVKQHINNTPVFTLPFDAELFGHWWYEGPEFLKQIIKKISASKDIELIAPSEIENENLDIVIPAESSWGREGYFKSWTNPESSWIYPELAHLDVRYNNIMSNDNSKASFQAMKELLLASASDWTFLISNDTSRDYGKLRLTDHINTATKIINDIESEKVDDNFISSRHDIYPIFDCAYNCLNLNHENPKSLLQYK